MENNLEKRIQELELRISILEKFLDTHGLTGVNWRGETTDVNALKIEVFRDLKKGKKINSINLRDRLGRNFYFK